MSKRDLGETLAVMIAATPDSAVELRSELRVIQERVEFHPPEALTLWWRRTHDALVKHIGTPRAPWELWVAAVFEGIKSMKDTAEAIASYGDTADPERPAKYHVDIQSADSSTWHPAGTFAFRAPADAEVELHRLRGVSARVVPELPDAPEPTAESDPAPTPMTLARAAKAVAELAEAHGDSTGLAVRAWSHKSRPGDPRHSSQTIEVWSDTLRTHLTAPTLAGVVEAYRVAMANREAPAQPLETMGPVPS